MDTTPLPLPPPQKKKKNQSGFAAALSSKQVCGVQVVTLLLFHQSAKTELVVVNLVQQLVTCRQYQTCWNNLKGYIR